MIIKMQLEYKCGIVSIVPIDIDDFLIELSPDKGKFIHDEIFPYIEAAWEEIQRHERGRRGVR
jgi:hypothetical protein